MNAAAIAPEPSAECRIYVACLASYNNGVLYGRWIDVDGKDADELKAEVADMLRGSRFPNVTRVACTDCGHIQDDWTAREMTRPDATCDECGGALGEPFPSAEEFAIHDHEGFGRMVGEYTSLDDVAAIAEGLSGGDALAFRWLVEGRGCSVTDAADKAGDVSIYQDEGAWTDDALLASYAQELVEDCYSEAVEALPGFIRGNIDWKGIGRDLRLGGDVDLAEIDGERFIVTNAAEF